MPKVHSHYENLKVARDASAEDIRAAYRVLTRKHHPDRNPDNRDAERVMSVINVAYGVLSDPVKRAEHDAWILQSEAAPIRTPRFVRGQLSTHAPSGRYRTQPAELEKAARQARFDRRLRRLAVHLRRFRIRYAIGGTAALFLLVAGIAALDTPAFIAPPGIDVSQGLIAQPGYTRADAAPNGQAWPQVSGYVEGYVMGNGGGLSEVLIDNSQNDADMFVKLVSLDGPSATPVRVFFVAANARFTVKELRVGTYDLRYRNLVSGGLLRSPAFILEEVPTARGTQHSTPTMKLYRSSDGSLQTYALPDADF